MKALATSHLANNRLIIAERGQLKLRGITSNGHVRAYRLPFFLFSIFEWSNSCFGNVTNENGGDMWSSTPAMVMSWDILVDQS